jgi:cold shock CspA family protein
MRVVKYVPSKLYGFTQAESEQQIFFHIRAFNWGAFPTYPPPIIGEEVDVEWNVTGDFNGKAPKAKRVHRTVNPIPSFGVVEDFNERQGYGFIRTADGRSHYLHRSEMTDGRLPMPGLEVTFFEGFRRGRTRACYVALSKGDQK